MYFCKKLKYTSSLISVPVAIIIVDAKEDYIFTWKCAYTEKGEEMKSGGGAMTMMTMMVKDKAYKNGE